MFEKRFCTNLSRRMMLAVACLGVLLTGGTMLAQQEQPFAPPKDGRYYESLARKAYQEKDYSAFLQNMKMAAELRPNHPRLMFNLAAAYALTGSGSEALQWLDRMTAMGLVFPAEKASEFDSIKGSAEFQTLLKKVERNKLPVINGAPAFTVHEKGFVPEGIAYDPVTRTFYLASVYKRKIVSVDQKGAARDFASEREGLWSVMGMKVDAARRLLWVATAAQPQMSHYQADENGISGILKFDLRTGKLLKKYILPNKPHSHWLGDLVLNSRGEVFATDSISPTIYFISPQKDEIESWLAGPPFVNLQGLDFAPDGKHLFVADYARGIFRVDLETRKCTELTPALDVTLVGIDGLYWYKGTLLGVQNGINPARLVRLFPSTDWRRIDRLETIEANDPAFDEPTLGVLVKESFYLIANSQWAAIDEKGQLAPEDKLKEPIILKIKLLR
jgi:sugar lactone lactonase YvrE